MFAKMFVSALVATAFLAGVTREAKAEEDRIIKKCPAEDIDCDGKANDFDDCPDVPGARSTCGCPDVDGDMFPEDVGQCPNGHCPETRCLGSYGQVDGLYRLLIDLCPPPADMSAKEFGGADSREREKYLETANMILDLDGCPGPLVNEDGDTFPNAVDQCRELSGSNKGCPGPDHDFDNDGVRNVDDKCPLVPAIFTETRVTDAFLEPGCPEDPYEVIYGSRVAGYFGLKGLDKDRKVRIEVARKSVAKPGIEVVWGGSTSGVERPKASKPNDRDADSIPDVKDQCPDEKEDFKFDSDILNPDGCPGEPVGEIEVATSPKPSEGSETEGRPLIIGGEVELEDVDEPEPPKAVPGDEDGDGIADEKDECPKVAGDRITDGCPPDLDTDGDGEYDWLDKCPTEPEDKDGFEDDDGCPDEFDPKSDTDEDGIDAINDRCPDIKGVPPHGCPVEEKKVAEATPAPEPPKAEKKVEEKKEPAKATEPEPASVPVVEPDHEAPPPEAPVPPEPTPEVKPSPPTPAPEPTTAPKAPVVEEEVVEPDLEPSPEPESEPEPEPAKPESLPAGRQAPLAEIPRLPDPPAAPSEPADDRDDSGVQPWSMGPCPVQDQPVNYIWTGAVGAVPPLGTQSCPSGTIPGVMGTADPISRGRHGQDDLDGRRATRVAPPDWDGGWCSLGITTIIGDSASVGCVEPLPTSVGLPGMGDVDRKIEEEVARRFAELPHPPPDLTKDVNDLDQRVSGLEAAPKSLVDWSAYPTVGVRLLPGVTALSLGAGLTFVDDWFVAEVEAAYTRARGSYIHDYGVEVGARPFGVRLGSVDVLSAIRVGQYAWAPFTLWQERQWGAGIAVSIRPFGDLIELDAELLGGEGWFPSSDPFTGHIQMTGQVTLRLNLGADPK